MQSQKWQLNKNDIKSILKWTLVFFAPPALIYFGQLSLDLSKNGLITNLIPNAVTVGAIESWALGILVNFFLALKEGK